MSLHALPSIDAQRAIELQKRKSTISSIVIAFLSLTLLALILAFQFLPAWNQPDEGMRAYWIEPQPDDPIDHPKVKIHTKPAPAPAAASRVLTSTKRADITLPDVPQTPTEGERIGVGDFGDDGLGGPGEGTDGGSFKPITDAFPSRCAKEERLKLIAEAGGDAKLDDHVVKALRFLKSTQAEDGGWGTQHRSAMTALALLAYLGHCETPESEEFGDSCLKGIVFLLNHAAQNNGRLSSAANAHHFPYEQSIATYALAEAYVMCQHLSIPRLRDTVQNSGQFLIDNQHPSGGWEYGYDETNKRGGDLSITGWHVQALHACAASKLDFKNLKPCIRKALDYVESLQHESGGFGYSGKNPAGSATWHTLTGTGMLCLQMNGRNNSPPVRNAARYTLKSAPFSYQSQDCDLYAHYYLALAMFQRGGKEWQTYQTRLIPALMEHQQADGSWPRPGGAQPVKAPGAIFAQESPTATHYRTCLATLSMEVYYRYLKTH
jgi:hypothetical protein